LVSARKGSLDVAQQRVSGFVVGSKGAGDKERWVVRIDEPGHPLNGEKVEVSSRTDTSLLEPGLKISFMVGTRGFGEQATHVALDVHVSLIEVARAEDREPEGETLNFVLDEHRDGSLTAHFVGLDSIEEARRHFDEATDGEERILALIKHPVIDPADKALAALVLGADELRDALEKLIDAALEASRTKGDGGR